MKKNLRPTLAAIAFFAAMVLLSVGTAQAQINLLDQTHTADTNPLLSTTGPNTVGAGRLQLSGNLGWNRFGYDNDYTLIAYDASAKTSAHIVTSTRDNIFDADLGLRYGIGDILELSIGLGGGMARMHTDATIDGVDTSFTDRSQTVSPTFGAKVCFFEGRGWLPQMALAASVSETLIRFDDGDFDSHSPSWAIGLQLRNRLGRRWLVDYSLGLASRESALGIRQPRFSLDVDYSLMARFLPTDRLMLGAGIDNGNGRFEALFQATPALQLKAQAMVATGLGADLHTTATYALVGIGWMIK